MGASQGPLIHPGLAPLAAMAMAQASVYTWSIQSTELVQPVDLPSPTPVLNVVDRLAAPIGFINQALLFSEPLDSTVLRAAVQKVLLLIPTLSCRATKTEVGCS